MGRVNGGLAALLLGPAGVVALGWMVGPAFAAPQQPTVTGGQSTIIQSGNTTTVHQTSQRSSINWQSFSIAPNEQVVFEQPNSSAISLDRVTGATASTIGGTIVSNGQVILINANGVLFAPGASVSVAGLIATTSDIADSDFLAGKMNFAQASPIATASVVNKGTIDIASGGYAVLSAAAVENDGVIQAKLGSVVLAGATAFTVDFTGDGLLQYAVTQGVNSSPGTQTLVEQAGTITADGGQVLLTARAAKGVIQHVINMDGVIEANGVARTINGKLVVGAITLDGGSSGDIGISGQIAGGTLSVSSGGDVQLAGAILNVSDGIVINTTGGQISIGGQTSTGGQITDTETTTTISTGLLLIDTGTIGTGPIITATSSVGGLTTTVGPTLTSGSTSTVVSTVETVTAANGTHYSVRVLSQCVLGSACAPTLTALLSGSNAGAVGQAATNMAAIGPATKGSSAPTPPSSDSGQPSGSSLIPGLLTDQTRPEN